MTRASCGASGRTTPGAVSTAVAEALQWGLGQAVAFEPNTDAPRFVVGASTASGLNYLYHWQDGVGVLDYSAFAGGTIYDLMWSNPSLHSGSRAVITSEGWGAIGSHTWLVDPDILDTSGFSGGNPGGAGFRPGGTFGALAGWTSNVLYVFSGTWKSTYLPGVNNGASPQAVVWRADGSRALVVGSVTGTNKAATVFEIRAGAAEDFDVGHLVNQSIPDFDDGPWFGDFNTTLFDADWRPGACDEGLIVGTDTASASFGLLIRFVDTDDAACPP